MSWAWVGLALASGEKLVSSPARDAAWWEVGAMPLLLLTGALLVLFVIVVRARGRISETGRSA